MALTAITIALSSGCGLPPDVVSDDGSQRGQLAVYTADMLDGRSETTYFLRDDLGREQRLLFNPVPNDLLPNGWIKVRGVPEGEALRVTRYENLPDPTTVGVIRSPIIGGVPYRTRTFAFILVDLGNGVNRTVADVNDRMTTGADSIKNYYLYDSFQRQDITTQVIGPLSYPMTSCNYNPMTTALRPMVTGTFDHYLWYFGSNIQSCGWSGLASVGRPDAPSRDTWYNASTSCVVLVQEPGHNFGMQHSSSLRCPSASFANNPNDCTTSEYGDPFDPMGGGCRHMNAYQKAYQGWFGGCNGVKITNSGTFTLLPIEPSCNGVQFLQVKAPTTRMFNRPEAGGGGPTVETMSHYYIELRAPIDFDGTLAKLSNGQQQAALAPMVLIHVAPELLARTARGVHTQLLDMTPSTTGSTGFRDAGLPVGQTFMDPGGALTITNQAMSASQATIVVTYTNGSGSPTCLDNSAFVAPGPSDCGSTGGAGTTGMAGTGGAGTTGAGGRGGTTGGAGTTGTGGRGGTTGGAGTTGTGGRGGTTGMAGTTGGAGTSGGAGTTGAAGTSGDAGTNGTTGDAGTTGAAGTTGEAGTTGTTGAGGVQGEAGTNGTGGTSGGTIIGGCNCDVGGGGPSPLGLMFGLGLAGIFLTRRGGRTNRHRERCS